MKRNMPATILELTALVTVNVLSSVTEDKTIIELAHTTSDPN